MEVFQDDNGKRDSLLPFLPQQNLQDNKLRAPSGRRSSLRLPSLGSIMESEIETQSFDSSDSAFEESSQFSLNSSFVDREDSRIVSVTPNITLEENEEKEIEKRVKQEFKQEFEAIKLQTKVSYVLLAKKKFALAF